MLGICPIQSMQSHTAPWCMGFSHAWEGNCSLQGLLQHFFPPKMPSTKQGISSPQELPQVNLGAVQMQSPEMMRKTRTA